MNIINMAVVYIALALTVISLIDYIAKNSRYLLKVHQNKTESFI